MKKIIISLLALPIVFGNVSQAAVAKKQSAIKSGTTVRTKTAVTGLYSEECYNMYYGCMDQFCIMDNVDGGSCACSDKNAGFESEIAEIQKIIEQANELKTVGVEKVKAGANADIIFAGDRQYDEDGNIIDVDDLEKNDANSKNDMLSLWDNSAFYGDVNVFDTVESTEPETGHALYNTANNLCKSQIPTSCAKDVILLEKMYSSQITSDCEGFENTVKNKKREADAMLASAQGDVRNALKDSLEESNKYDQGQCMVEFKKCMQTDDACGSDWENCVFTIAGENMQNNLAVSTAGTKAKTINTYDITASTMEILDSKRMICENVLENCVAVRDNVWPAFLREAAPTIRLAELKSESKKRQSCLTDISDCIQTACRDDIVGRGTATMDACLSRPDMARSFCKVEIDTCERMEPLIWGYVVDKLAAMRVDACTNEVKECFTSDDRCGSDFGNCIGVDYDTIKNMCPIDKLVVCRANNPEFSMDDLDSMLAGLYLNIDNSALENCENLIDEKMIEVCGSLTDCNKFASDDNIGTSSLKSQKDGNIYRISGMISFGQIKMGQAGSIITDSDEELMPGEIGVADYMKLASAKNTDIPNHAGIISSIESELNNIAGTINRTISIIEQDPQIQYCLNGRELNQKSGKFPNLLNETKMLIAMAALRVANDNYNAKLNEQIEIATKDSSADVAQYMCQMMPAGNSEVSGTIANSTSMVMAQPYDITYDVSSGVSSDLLLSGGTGISNMGATSLSTGNQSTNNFNSAIDALGSAASMGTSQKIKVDMPGGTIEKWSSFNRDTRICRYCTTTITKSCSTQNTRGFLGIGSKNNVDCTESEPVESCQDIQM